MHILKRHSINFHFLSFSFIFFHFSFFFLSSCSSSFLGCSIFFCCLDCLTISNSSSYVKKHFFRTVSGERHTPLGPLFFSLVYFSFFSFSSSFSISFHVFLCFSLFQFLFHYFPFCFPVKKCFFLFSFCSLFSFLECSKSVGALQDSLGKVHILSWLYLLCIGSSSLYHVE